MSRRSCFCDAFLRKSQGNSPRFAGSTKLRTVFFHVPLFYDPMYNLSIFYPLSILQSISQSFHNLLLFTIFSNIYYIYIIVSIYLPFSEVHTPLRVQCRSKGNITGGAHERRRREPLGGSGGMLRQKNLKARGLEMLFPAFSKSDM